MDNEKKLRVAVICGGKSGEHEVSLVSGFSVLNALNKDRYDLSLLVIDHEGRWFSLDAKKALSGEITPQRLDLKKNGTRVTPLPFPSEKFLIDLSKDPSQSFVERNSALSVDVILPILHGPYGEDGVVQGLFELANKAYVGSGVLGSSVGMDKDVARRLMKQANIPVVPTLVFRNSDRLSAQKMAHQSEAAFGYPYFVKPCNMGSSVGVSKVKSADQAEKAFQDAFLYDTKVLVEKGLAARELECAVLGGLPPKASIVGEIVPTHDFYSYEAKYKDENGAELHIPAKGLDPETTKRIQDLSVLAFQTLECHGLARVDFFLDKVTGELYLNEINTMPGFTKISMYPKLWAASGLPYPELLDQLIQLALKRHQQKEQLKTQFDQA